MPQRDDTPVAGAFPLVVLLAIGAPALCLWLRPDLADAVLVGAGAWAMAVAVKLWLARARASKQLQAAGRLGASGWGAVSALCELGLFAGAAWTGLIAADIAKRRTAQRAAATGSIPLSRIVTTRSSCLPAGACLVLALAWR